MKNLIALVWLMVLGSLVSAQTIHVRVGKGRIIGKPVSWTDHLVSVLERDGKISQFMVHEAKDYKVLSKQFKLLTYAELKSQLHREFGKRFDVTGTGQYLVVHPAGQRDLWAQRFEELYRSMVSYYSTRGIRTKRASLPLIAIVFPSKQLYLNYLRAKLNYDGNGKLGIYGPDTNRIYLYDITTGRPDNADWYTNAETVIHESAHQTAYNIGVHRRYGANPSWVVEGIGTMFEARGVWNGSKYRDFSDRVHLQQVANFKKNVNSKNAVDSVKQIIASDNMFNRTPTKAYALAWMMTFYATETRSQQYANYVNRLYKRKAFDRYSAGQRVADFKKSFGDVQLFTSQMMSYIDAKM